MAPPSPFRFLGRALVLALALCLATPALAHGEQVSFNASLLAGHHHPDLTPFNRGVQVVPGSYEVDVYLNRDWVGTMRVRFAAPSPDTDAKPCITKALIDRMPRLQLGKAQLEKLDTATGCVHLGDLVAHATAHFDRAVERLEFSVPEAKLKQTPRGYVPPSVWTDGAPAFRLNYRFNAVHNDAPGLHRTSAYLGLASGLNLGAWRIRQRGTLDWAPGEHHWNTAELFARRALPGLSSELTFGDSYTDGQVFESYPLVGLQLGTDDRMLAPSRRGYAPVVRGVAHSNAKITIRQHGVEIYQAVVPPGPFVINDLYPTSYGGPLEVSITEADGRERSYEVPYASVPQLERAGATRYSMDAGQVRDLGRGLHPSVLQATVQHGFSNRLTGYAGFQASSGYNALLLGTALNTRAGAFSLDLTGARTAIPGYGTYRGTSLGLAWSKTFSATDTRFSVAADRYSTSGFLDLREAATARGYAIEGMDPFHASDGSRALRRRNRLSLSLNQSFAPGGGRLFAGASYNDYYGSAGSSSTFQVGYNNHFGGVSYGLSLSRTRDASGGYENSVLLSLSVPLGGSGHSPMLTASLNRDSQGADREQATLAGTYGRHNPIGWDASVGHGPGGVSASVGAGYQTSHGDYTASYAHGPGYSQVSAGATGSLVAHPGGLTFGPPLGKTIAVVHAPGATGARVEGAGNVKVDSQGYAIVPNLMPFQLNRIGLDPKGASMGVQLESTSTKVAPTAGAVVMVNFKTQHGQVLMVRLRRADGTALPFGTEVLEKGRTVGTVGQGGQALLRVHQPSGELTVQVKGKGNSCRFHYRLAKGGTRPVLKNGTVVCQRGKAP